MASSTLRSQARFGWSLTFLPSLRKSLSINLLQGPDLTNNLSGVLCRFRLESVAFMCDIEVMFYQVRVTEDCRDMLRFLWWENDDTSRQPQEYRLTVHLHQQPLKTTADDNENKLGSAPAEFLRKDFYVNNGLKSVPSVGEAMDLIKGVKEMCKRGGFNLHKFTSNKKEVIRGVPVEDRAEEIKLPMEHALGVQWCVESACFCFRITLSILSTVSSIYDLLGFLAQFLLEGKKIIQELCQEKADWDDPVPDHMRHRWDNWKAELAHLDRLNRQRMQRHHLMHLKKGVVQCSLGSLDANNEEQQHVGLVGSEIWPFRQRIFYPRKMAAGAIFNFFKIVPIYT